MRLRFNTYAILGGLFVMLASSGLAFADNAARMAEMQKALNDEVLAKPFGVAEPTKRSVVSKTPEKPYAAPRYSKGANRLSVYPRLSLGFHYGYHSHGFGLHYGHYPHRYRWHKGHHFHLHRYRHRH